MVELYQPLDGRVESATCSFSKFSEAIYHTFRPKLFMQLCIVQFRMPSPEWLNITVKSTICQVCMIILLSTSTNLSLFYSLGDNKIGDKGATGLGDALRVNQNLKTLR